jgi:hypothetical protein
VATDGLGALVRLWCGWIGRASAASCVVLMVCAISSPAASAALTIGPPDVSSAADSGGVSCGGGTQLDCAVFNLTDNRGGLVQAPSDGTITSWSVGGLEGTGRLLVIAAVAGGRYEIVAKSAQETEPCVMSNGTCGGEGPGVVNPQYTFPTDLPISAGEMLGIELISPSGCFTIANPTSQGCGFVGADAHNPVAGTATFWNQTPPLGVPTAPSSNTAFGEQVLVNAAEQPSSITQTQQADLVQACDAAQAGTAPSAALSGDGYNVGLNVAEPGTVTANVEFDGSGSSGSSVLVFDGTGAGSSVLVFDGSGGSGSSVLVFDGSGGSGSSVLTFDGSTGSGSSVLAFSGGNPTSGPVLASPDGSMGLASAQQSAALACQVTFEGSGGSGSSVAADSAAKHHPPSGARLCIRKITHAPARCSKLRRRTPTAIASLTRTFSTTGHVMLHIPLSKLGRLMLLAAREADRLYHHRHPHSHKHPSLRLKVTLSFKPGR